MTIKINKDFSGYGGKRPLLYIPHAKLWLDPDNPRLPVEAQGREESKIKDSLKRFFSLDELAISMSRNGYFDEEPLVAIPKNLPERFKGSTYDQLKNNEDYEIFLKDSTTEFIVVEGNRRLCTVKLLLSGEVATFPLITEEVRKDLSELPVIIYPQRRDVIAYLGVRHIVGVKKWDAYAKARYIASMIEDFGLSLEEVQESVGDTSNSVRKTYTCYRLIEEVKEEYEDYDISKAKENFSYLLLGIGQGPIKEFIGLPKSLSEVNFKALTSKDKKENLYLLFSWLFGEGRARENVIKESRDITARLSVVLRDTEATAYLKQFRNLGEAYELSEGKSQLLLKYLKQVNRDLGKSLPLVGEFYNNEVEYLLVETARLLNDINTLKRVGK